MLYLLAASIAISGVLSEYSCNSGACVLVNNECPFPLYLQRSVVDGDDTNPHTVHIVNSKEAEVMDISGWRDLPGQRLYAWWQDPVGQNLHPLRFRDKVEINWCGTSPDRMCYNPTAVDYIGLPVTMGPYKTSDCPSVPYTGQDRLTVADIQSRCPTQFQSAGVAGICLSPYQVCVADPGNALCSHLDSKLAECKASGQCAQESTTTQAYGCSYSFSQKPELCAALNRGLYPNIYNQGNYEIFYKNEPFNAYAQFVHTNNAKHYAFAYDDVGGQRTSGYNECHTNFLSVTFCPSG